MSKWGKRATGGPRLACIAGLNSGRPRLHRGRAACDTSRASSLWRPMMSERTPTLHKIVGLPGPASQYSETLYCATSVESRHVEFDDAPPGPAMKSAPGNHRGAGSAPGHLKARPQAGKSKAGLGFLPRPGGSSRVDGSEVERAVFACLSRSSLCCLEECVTMLKRPSLGAAWDHRRYGSKGEWGNGPAMRAACP